MSIPLSSPEITEEDIEAVVRVLRSTQLSLGPKMLELEELFGEYIGIGHAVALSSGTAGLHIGLEALGIGPGDEVILPSFTFVAAANAVLQARATPVFAEIDPVSLNLNADSLGRVISERSRAILLVHTFGYPADLDPILELARKHKLFVIEDACEAIGAEYKGRKVGGFGDLGVFSFYPNKPLTMGEGGIAVTNNSAVADAMRALRNQGRSRTDSWLQHSMPGYNYRLPEMNCALGISQLSRIEAVLRQRKAVAAQYDDALIDLPDLTRPAREASNGSISWFAYVARLNGRLSETARDRLLGLLTAAGIGCRDYFPPIHRLPTYRKFLKPGQRLQVTEQVASRTLALPFYNALRRDQILEVCKALRSGMAELTDGAG